jgi:hypothetical protein
MELTDKKVEEITNAFHQSPQKDRLDQQPNGG